MAGFGADFAYTLDGGDITDYEYETFNAAKTVVTINGFSIHPGSSKDKMKNALLIAMEYNALLPAVLHRGTMRCPDMEQLAAAMDRLYGAQIMPHHPQAGGDAVPWLRGQLYRRPVRLPE